MVCVSVCVVVWGVCVGVCVCGCVWLCVVCVGCVCVVENVYYTVVHRVLLAIGVKRKRNKTKIILIN